MGYRFEITKGPSREDWNYALAKIECNCLAEATFSLRDPLISKVPVPNQVFLLTTAKKTDSSGENWSIKGSYSGDNPNSRDKHPVKGFFCVKTGTGWIDF